MTRFQPILLWQRYQRVRHGPGRSTRSTASSPTHTRISSSAPYEIQQDRQCAYCRRFQQFRDLPRFHARPGQTHEGRGPGSRAAAHPLRRYVCVNLLSQCGDDLRKYFVYNTLDINLSRRRRTNPLFYQICEQYDLPHPKTKTVTADEVKAGEYRNLPFSYPVAEARQFRGMAEHRLRRPPQSLYLFNDPAELRRSSSAPMPPRLYLGNGGFRTSFRATISAHARAQRVCGSASPRAA